MADTRQNRKAAAAEALSVPDQIPWERLPTEKADEYYFFSIYRDLGPKRTVRQVYRVLNGKEILPKLEVLSAVNRWVERAQAYDDYHDHLRLETVERVTIEQIEKQVMDWAAIRDRIRKDELDVGYQALDLAKKMIARVLEQLQDADYKVRVSQIAMLLKTADDLLRNAAELSTERVDVKQLVQQAAADVGLDPNEVMAEVDVILKGR